MAWLKKAKIEPKIEKKKELKRQEEEDVEESVSLPEELGEEQIGESVEPELVSRKDEPRQAQQQQQSQVPLELQPDSAKFYQQEPVVQKVMFLPLQPEMHELITLAKQQAQISIAVGNMLGSLVEGQKVLLAGQQETNKLLGQLIKEIEMASQSNTM
jgi:hypothetical protein